MEMSRLAYDSPATVVYASIFIGPMVRLFPVRDANIGEATDSGAFNPRSGWVTTEGTDIFGL